MIPNVETCYQLMDQYRMLDNIKAHSIIVCRVAELISQAYIQRGDPLNLDLVIASSLLHDIAKTPCLNGGCDHASVGEEICRKHEFDEVADIVAEHVLIKSNGRGDITEKEIVYYADKRVNHDKVVSLDDRLAYILERYGSSSKYRYESIMENFKKCQQMEKRIFTGLEFAPPDVGALILSQKGWSA